MIWLSRVVAIDAKKKQMKKPSRAPGEVLDLIMKHPRRPILPLLGESQSKLHSRPIRKRDPDQPSLPFDPMPLRVEPCLALLKPTVPVGPDWLYEVKWDGYRLAIHIEPKGVRVITRGGHDWTHRFPIIVAAAKELGVTTAILDGEAVVLDDQGRSDFGALQRSLGGRGGKRVSTESILVAFDLLYLDGHDLTSTELDVRLSTCLKTLYRKAAIRRSAFPKS